MELDDILQTKFDSLGRDEKQRVFEVISNIAIESIPKKHAKKVFEIAQKLLIFKGKEVENLRKKSSTTEGSEQDSKEWLDENARLKKTIGKLESDKAALKTRIKDLSEDVNSLRKRLQETNASDKDDSSDLLSDIDRKEELLKNINAKNKHIKRLLRDIEALEKKTLEQTKVISTQNEKLDNLEIEYSRINEQYITTNEDNKRLNELLMKAHEETENLATITEQLEAERERIDAEFKMFVDKLEEKAHAWRNILIDKEQQLEAMHKKYEELYLKYPNENKDACQELEITQLVEAMQERDGVIQELEGKLRIMAEEMMASTQLMNKISHEYHSKENMVPQKQKQCCEELAFALDQAKKRSRELSEILDNVEEDNVMRSRQAAEAISVLQAYENGMDGLPQSLRKIGYLEQKLNSRDKQIKALVMEINSLHEIAQENLILRKKLNIPEDAVISTTSLSAKQKTKDKLIDRLSLKLRASEEMRLNLKLEMNELRKENKSLRSTSQHLHTTFTSEMPMGPQTADTVLKCKSNAEVIYCANCLKMLKELPNKYSIVQEVNNEWESKYSSVIEENENLRVGMHEILEKIREYDASSDHITIDCTILEKLLHALDARSVSGWYHPAMRMQNELIALKEREHALKEQISIVEKAAINKTKDSNIDLPMRVATDENNQIEDAAKQIPSPHEIVLSKTDSLYAVVVQKDIQYELLREKLLDISQKYRDILLENDKIKCFERLYVEIKTKLESSDDQITQYCAVLVEKLSDYELKLNASEKKYAFLLEDYEQTVKELKDLKFNSASVVAELKAQIINRNIPEVAAENEIANSKYEESEALKNEIISLKIQLAFIVKEIVEDDTGLKKIQENVSSFIQYGIIEEDFRVGYLTCQEYNQMKLERDQFCKDIQGLKQHCRHLEKLLVVADEQIKSQQKQLIDLTDNQVNLRHLVADLQSSNEDKLIIAKGYRDIEKARDEINKVKREKQEVESNYCALQSQLKQVQDQKDTLERKQHNDQTNETIKLQFLKKSLFLLQEKYCKFTPLVLLSDFLQSYACVLAQTKSDNSKEIHLNIDEEIITSKFKIDASKSDANNLVKVIKSEAKCQFLEEQVLFLSNKVTSLQSELEKLKLSIVNDTEHWKTVKALFSEPCNQVTKTFEDKMIQCEAGKVEASTNTDSLHEFSPNVIKENLNLPKIDDIISCPSSPSIQTSRIINVRSLENQLKQAMQLASTRNALLLETENKLAESQGRIKEMEKLIEEKKLLLKQELDKHESKTQTASPHRTSLVESTIKSLQTLLTEKDTTLNHYQKLLKTEREQHTKSCESYEKELEALQMKHNELDVKFKTKCAEVVEVRTKLESLQKQNNQNSTRPDTEDEFKQLDDCDNNFNEISDEKIEEMFLDDNKQLSQELLEVHTDLPENDEPISRYIHKLQTQLNETTDREKFWEKSSKTKEDEVQILKEKLSLLEERGKLETKVNPEIEQLQTLLEEKDKHINDLMDTLSNFHDDQQCLINETSIYSADQVTQLGADLSRSETTNRILSTQLEALRRQVANLTQREKQARELASSLRNQLIKRPVVSVKTELNTRARHEQLQKRLNFVETELEDMRKENKRLTNLVEEKRAKNANELALWDKQKRWQQNAERLKMKLSETEANLEKTKMMLNTAKNTISRLEKEKGSLETRIRSTSLNKCCRTPSCPNLILSKYCPSETPETYTTSSECNSPAHGNLSKVNYVELSDTNIDIINALKTRIESQQRRIVALELERKGSNALTTELEKNQEKLAAIEAQNIRLEAKNLQLQLDIDLLRQGDEKERSQKRIKYLEDYVLALKEELAQTEARKSISMLDEKTSTVTHPEQTILSLRRIVERLRVENKNLKDARTFSGTNRDSKAGGDLMQELQEVKEKLRQKAQLLEKAKILLTRAAAKEKNLKEQLTIWKRKCSELQNVPVIDEISE